MRDNLARFYANARKYLTVVILVGSALTVAMIPDEYAFPALVGWLVLSGIIFAAAFIKTRSVIYRFDGALKEFATQPTPMTSIVDLMARYGVSPEEMDQIILMSSDVRQSLDYLFGEDSVGGAFGKMLHQYPHIRATIYGHQGTLLQQANYPVTLKFTPKRRTEHTNLITVKDGRAFVWYEPYHLVENGRHYFTRGAYLVEIQPAARDKLLREFYPALITDNSKKGLVFSAQKVAA